MFKHKKYLVLLTILLLGFVLRFYRLGTYPALNADEAALGYNTYSLIKTGLDEHGNRWPIYFQSFNDYKPALTGYLMMPTIYFFGLSVWSVRVIPAFISFLTIFVVYLLVRKLFLNERFALMSSFILAINPWHIHFSRGAWEVSVATFFVTLGLYFFIKFLEKPKYLLLSGVFFILSLYTYHAARILVPLLGIGLIVLFYKRLMDSKKQSLITLLVSFVICVPLGLSLFSSGGLARASGVALWSNSGPLDRANELRGDYQNTNGIIAKVAHNKPVAYSLAFLSNYTEHFWGEFLFLSGDDIQRNKVPETGELHLIEVAFIAVSLIYISRKITTKWKVILWWLIVAPIPAAITFQSPHALRSQSMAIPLSIISSFGLFKICEITEAINKKFKVISGAVLLFCFVLILGSTIRYLHEYYGHMSKEFPFSSQYGVKELFDYIRPIENRYQNIVVTDRYDQPYILFLFYGASVNDSKYSPERFQADHKLSARDLYGFSTVRAFDNLKFESIDFERAKAQYPNSLLIGTDQEIPDEANILQEIYGSNGYKYFEVVVN